MFSFVGGATGAVISGTQSGLAAATAVNSVPMAMNTETVSVQSVSGAAQQQNTTRTL